MPSFLLSRNTPQRAASVPCCSRTRRSSSLNPAVISRRSFSVGGVISKVAMAFLLTIGGVGGILSHNPARSAFAVNDPGFLAHAAEGWGIHRGGGKATGDPGPVLKGVGPL